MQEIEIWNTSKLFMHNSESVKNDETHKVFLGFWEQTDRLISARWPDPVIVNKKREPAELWTCGTGGPQNKDKRKWKEI